MTETATADTIDIAAKILNDRLDAISTWTGCHRFITQLKKAVEDGKVLIRFDKIEHYTSTWDGVMYITICNKTEPWQFVVNLIKDANQDELDVNQNTIRLWWD